jgi:hypothetical protein
MLKGQYIALFYRREKIGARACFVTAHARHSREGGNPEFIALILDSPKLFSARGRILSREDRGMTTMILRLLK